MSYFGEVYLGEIWCGYSIPNDYSEVVNLKDLGCRLASLNLERSLKSTIRITPAMPKSFLP